MNFLFVGLGSIGQRHLRNLKKIYPKCKISSFRVLNRKLTLNNKNKLIKSDLNKKYNIKVYKKYSEALNAKPDAVFICNPTSFHIDYALQAARKKINIFIDKPLSNNLQRLNLLRKLVKKNNLVFFVGYQLRFSKSLNYIKKIIDKNILGKLCGANIYNGEYLPDYHKYEDYKVTTMAQKKLGGGVINSQIHEIDYCLYLFGKSKKSFSKVGKFSDFKIDVEDYINSLIIFQKNNIAVNITMDFYQRPPIREMMITGTKKSLKWLYYRNQIIINDYKTNKIKKINFGKFDRNQMFIDQTKYFIKLLKKKSKNKISNIDNGIEAIKVAQQIKTDYLKS